MNVTEYIFQFPVDNTVDTSLGSHYTCQLRVSSNKTGKLQPVRNENKKQFSFTIGCSSTTSVKLAALKSLTK